MKWIAILLTLMLSVQVVAEELAVVAPPATSQNAASAATAKANLALKENEIPVQLESVKKAENVDSALFRMLMVTVLIGFLFGGSVLYMKRIKKMKKGTDQATEIKVLTQHYLGPKKSLAIIRVAGESILIGVTDQNINLIKQLSLLDEDIPEAVPTDFKETMENQDDFSISGIKDVVTNRLKNMRSFQ